MLNYGKFYGNYIFLSLEIPVPLVVDLRVSLGRMRRQITTRIRRVGLRKQGHLLASQSARQKLHNKLVRRRFRHRLSILH